MSEKPIKIMFNEDPNHHIGEICEARKYLGEDFKITEEMEKEFVYQYKGTQLTDYLINVNFMCSIYPVSYTHLDVYKRQDLNTYKGKCYLGVDSGSTTTKAALINESGEPVSYTHLLL